MLRNLLLYRLTLLNGCAAAALVWAQQRGFLDYLDRDGSRISYAILAVFAVGMASIFYRAAKVSRALNGLKARQPARVNAVKFVAKGEHISLISSLCVGLGFFGTVVGIIAMLFGNGGITSDGSVESITSLIEQILHGAGIAFITTATGLSTSLWLDLNAQILGTATACMLSDSAEQPA